ncbi:winged helix-turn-helix domain-containing protein [Halococcus sp. IIIV-5B]|uniref:helix-turn-helix transcriptional regulator n=1 Tax=Halococcus sp. IIIV-5B TaxID=2321230 RepID=UPI000E76C157|nr:helix-turn-helix domain-containing protein [Halococcus sp. IIIV-5B]RJT02675.1 ArsR family transcriptional regulator [Halococcus sp. IIIV-5B]
METERLIDLVRRAPVLDALRSTGGMDRRELERHLGVSKSTVHRFTRALRDEDLVERSAGEFVLTPLGEVSAETLAEFETTIETAWAVAPVLEAAAAHDVQFDVAAFANATVTTAEPGNPYRPVSRFMSLVNETETLRGLDPASINPLHLDEIYERIVDGMRTDAVFPPEVVEELLRTNPERAEHAFASGNLALRVHDDLPFGLTLCDDRVGVGVYGDETGLLRTYVDTDAPAAREWAEAVYTSYREEAAELTDHADLADLESVAALVGDT